MGKIKVILLLVVVVSLRPFILLAEEKKEEKVAEEEVEELSPDEVEKEEYNLSTEEVQKTLVEDNSFKGSEPIFQVKIGGFLDSQVAYAEEKSLNAKNSHPVVFTNNTRIDLDISQAINANTKVGGKVQLLADVSKANDNRGENADKTYLYLDSKYGKVEIGAVQGVEDSLKVDASTIAFGTGGIDGDYYKYINIGGYLFSPDLFAQSLKGRTENANKINYISPLISGLQFGFSYAPDSGDAGTTSGITGDNNIIDQQNLFSYGLAYEKTFTNLSLRASITGLKGSAENSLYEDINQYALGLAFNYKGFSLSGSYGDWGNYTDVIFGKSKADFYTIGGAYEIGPVGISATFMESKNALGSLSNLSLGFSLEFIKGLKPYFEANFYDAEKKDGSNFNHGTVFLTGTEVIF